MTNPPTDPSRPPVAPGYPQNPYPQNAYPQNPSAPQYAAPVVAYLQPQPRGFSITALVLGLTSILFGFTFLVPVGAIVFGIVGLKKEPTGKGMAVTGIVIGGVFLLGWVLLGAFIFASIAAVFGVAATVPSYSY